MDWDAISNDLAAVLDDWLIDRCTIARRTGDLEDADVDPETFAVTVPDATIVAEDVACMISSADATEIVDGAEWPGLNVEQVAYRLRLPAETSVQTGDYVSVTTARNPLHAGLSLRIVEGAAHTLSPVVTVTAVTVDQLPDFAEGAGEGGGWGQATWA